MFHIRHAVLQDAEAIANVHVASWRTTYRGVVPDSYLSDLSAQKRAEMWKRQLSGTEQSMNIFVAETEQGEIIGFASGGRSRSDQLPYEGELYAIYLLEVYQRLGIGRKLMLSVGSQLRETGYRSMLVWALEDNGYCAFYESLGGESTAYEDVEIGGISLREVGYGWDDLDALILNLERSA
ncbi:GNAT family N-acetyltransferase [Paenibacillus sp. D2_2]|uniref:GNAT family N-acetyltransferase n=1 Tax=Paenibacillus sp. D2_2 TaxID=3073092 RepID=UPI002814B006|nr:GNAT family N-acetyltransferase [Paenibacillus sp. D2_2]WMT38848.1 GNAT family N-acetyltransferase [Paenibacillus sp. D2_2]